jgi:hypothetical protein
LIGFYSFATLKNLTQQIRKVTFVALPFETAPPAFGAEALFATIEIIAR